MPPPENSIFDQALETANIIQVLERLGSVPGQTREGVLRELEAAGLSVEPGTVTRSLVDASYPEVTGSVAADVRVGDQVRVGDDPSPYTVTSVQQGSVMIQANYSQIEQRLAAVLLDPPYDLRPTPSREGPVPGGRALRYEATTRIRFPASPTGRVPRQPGSTNPHGEMELGDPQYIDDRAEFTMQITKSKIWPENLAEAFEAAEKPRGPSVWWWLRHPIV